MILAGDDIYKEGTYIWQGRLMGRGTYKGGRAYIWRENLLHAYL